MKIEIKKFLAIAFSLVFLFLTFVPLASATENEITEVNITVPVPKVGEKIPYHDAITVDNEKCRVGLIGWFYEKNGVQASVQSEVFLPDFNYSLFLFVDVKDENYKFADDCVVTVNGNSAEYMVTPSGNSISVGYDFGTSESSSDSSISYPELIKGYIQEIFERISHIIEQAIISIFGIRVFNSIFL